MSGLWTKLSNKAFRLKTTESLLAENEQHHGELEKVLSAFDLLMFGIGGIIGAGVFVLTGEAAKEYAGPAVVVSFAVASIAALFSALCYAEFAAEVPVAGSAYNYISLVYGELFAWISAMNFILEWVLVGSIVAKGFSGYFATLIGVDIKWLAWEVSYYIAIDWLAVVLMLALTILLCMGIKQSAVFQNTVTGINLFTVFFVLAASIPFFKTENLVPFAPMGTVGVFRAASVLFLSYIGFDGVAAAAEEVKDPKKALPIGIVGSLVVCAILYILMALGIVGMQSYEDIDTHAPFSVAFKDLGLEWVAVIISFGALTGIVTSLVLCLFTMARTFMVLAREGFIPSFIATVNTKTHTPVNATILVFLLSGVPALVLNMHILANMVSMGTLFVLSLVCSGTLWRTYYQPDETKYCLPQALLLGLLFLGGLIEGLASEHAWPIWVQGGGLGIWLIGTVGFCFIPVAYRPSKFVVPLKPLTPALGMLFTIHLICSLGVAAYIRFGVWQILGLLFYICYSVHHTSEARKEGQTPLLSGMNPPQTVAS